MLVACVFVETTMLESARTVGHSLAAQIIYTANSCLQYLLKCFGPARMTPYALIVCTILNVQLLLFVRLLLLVQNLYSLLKN